MVPEGSQDLNLRGQTSDLSREQAQTFLLGLCAHEMVWCQQALSRPLGLPRQGLGEGGALSLSDYSEAVIWCWKPHAH